MSSTLRKGELKEPLSEIAAGEVPCDAPLPFDLYVSVGERYIKYRHKGGVLEKEERDRLVTRGLAHFFHNGEPSAGAAGADDGGEGATGVGGEEGDADGVQAGGEGGGDGSGAGDMGTQLVSGGKEEEDNSLQIISSKSKEEEEALRRKAMEEAMAAKKKAEEEKKFDPVAQAKKNKSVINKLLQMEKKKPKDISVKVALAKAYIEANRMDDSLQLYKTLKRKFGSSPAGMIGIIEVYMLKNWAQKAQTEFEELEAAYPDDPNIERLKMEIQIKLDAESAEKMKMREENAAKRENAASANTQKMDKLFKK